MREAKLEAPTVTSVASTSLRVIATAIIFVSLYYASTVIISLICAVFIAFVLEPGVKLMLRLRLPRWLGSFIMVVAALAVMYLVIYAVYDRVVDFTGNLPAFTARLKQIITHFQVTFRNIRLSAGALFPSSAEPRAAAVQVQEGASWVQYLVRGIGSAYGILITVMFIPFLVFFMLTGKDQIWLATLNLFPSDHQDQAQEVIRGISRMVRQYVLGNVLVALISAGLLTPVFAVIDLRYALLVGPVAAFLSMIPYIGLILALVPPLLLAIVQPEYKDILPFAIIIVSVVLVHLLAMNILTPKLVGRRVKLNALTVTIAMMFWGWLWGGIGLLLAVPITAAIKAVCDHVERLKVYGDWMGG